MPLKVNPPLPPPDLADAQRAISEVCKEIETLLLGKNKKYGNSAVAPRRIFSKASPREQLYVRIDDKLSRIETSGLSDVDEDTLQDLIGYLVLLKVYNRLRPGSK